MGYSTSNPFTIAEAEPSARAEFIRKTYAHVAFAILSFIGLEYLLLGLPIVQQFAAWAFSTRFGWLGVLGGFMVISWIARGLANALESKAMQYAGLALYVLAEALIFAPLLIFAKDFVGPEVILDAAIMTFLMFGGLTATVLITRKDFSFLKSTLMVGGFIALGLIIFGVFFGLSLGVWFSVGMIVLASGAILYDTSKILHEYDESQYVVAALELFASIALLFWYILRLLISIASRA